MKKLLAVSLLFSSFAFSPAQGEGALAVGVPAGGPKDGYAYGLNVRNVSAAQAEERALDECKRQAERYGVDRTLCRVVASFSKRCVSVAFDVQARSAGWAVADTSQATAADAVKKCAESGARSCKPHNTDCDF